MKLGMIDYGRGNLRSVINACESLGHNPKLVSKASEIKDLTHIIFPGQGAFGDCMESLQRLDLISPLQDWIKSDKPYFGICVGYQLLFETGEESPGTRGLELFSGEIDRFTDTSVKIPHMGWNSIKLQQPHSTFWNGFQPDPYFYFVHSYYPKNVDPSLIAATCQYGNETFCAAIQKGNLLATQFHPEKSQHAGLQLLKNFLTRSGEQP